MVRIVANQKVNNGETSLNIGLCSVLIDMVLCIFLYTGMEKLWKPVTYKQAIIDGIYGA